MIFNEKISTELKDIIKACTSKQERFKVAEKRGVSLQGRATINE